MTCIDPLIEPLLFFATNVGSMRFPLEPIPCIHLTNDEVNQPYSMPVVAPHAYTKGDLWSLQCDSFKRMAKQPPYGLSEVKANSKTTINQKLKSMEEFVGFCVLHLGEVPTMELVLDPCNVASFEGFLTRKCCAPTSIKKVVDNCRQMAHFVMHPTFPKNQDSWEQEYLDELKQWYITVVKRYDHVIKKGKAPLNTPHLQECWDHIEKEWEEFLARFQVSSTTCTKTRPSQSH